MPLRTRRPSWVLTATVAGMPLWWAMGLAAFIWIIAAVPMAWILLHRTPIRAPKGFGLFVLFLGWVMISAAPTEGLRIISVGYRVLIYIAAAIVLLYVFNLSESELPRARVLKLCALYFMYAIAGGYAALVLGDLRFTSPAELIAPGAVLDNPWAGQMLRPAFAQTQDIFGVPLPRPTAPFVFTNEWGSGVGFLAPVVIAAWSTLGRRWQSAITVVAIAGLVPIIVSINRGLWIALVFAIAYGTALLAHRGDTRFLRGALAGVVLVVIVAAVTPLGALVSDRLDNGHSDTGRMTLYTQAIDQVKDSPWIGYGAPRVNEERPGLPAVGTHGQFWTVLYSHGIPGAILFVAFSLSLAFRTVRAQDRVGVWLHVTIALVPVLMLFYDVLNQPIFVIMLAAGLALRGAPRPHTDGPLPVLDSSQSGTRLPTETRTLVRNQ